MKKIIKTSRYWLKGRFAWVGENAHHLGAYNKPKIT